MKKIRFTEKSNGFCGCFSGMLGEREAAIILMNDDGPDDFLSRIGMKWLNGMGLAAMLGFSGVVEVLYPVLGGGCLALLAAAKFTNYNRNAFHSRGDML